MENKEMSIADGVRIIKKRWWLFIVSALLFLAIGFYMAKKQPGYYTSTLYIASTATNGTQIEKVVAHLIELRLKGGAGNFAEKLKIKKDAAESLRTLAFKNPKSDNEYEVYTAEIEMQLNSTDHVAELGNGIITYIQSNTFLNKQTEEIRNSLKAYIHKSESDLHLIDSLRSNYVNGNMRGIPYEAFSMYGDPGEIREALVEYKMQLARTNVADLVAEPVIPVSKTGRDKSFILSAAFLLSQIVAFVLSAGIELWKKV